MLKPRERHGAFLCLSAAFFALLTPMAFLLHLGYCGAAVPGCANPEYSTVYEHAHRGGTHAPNDCMTCQALLQYVSGVTLGHAHEVSVPVKFIIHDCVVSSIPPCENYFSPFFSRAPPLFSASVHS